MKNYETQEEARKMWPMVNKDKKAIEANRERAHILDLSDRDFKIIMINILKDLVEKVNIHEQMWNFVEKQKL